MKASAELLGRILLATIFFYEAVDTVWYFNDAKDIMTDYGITWKQDFLLVSVIFFLALGAFLVLIGYAVRLGGFLLLLYLIPFTFVIYSFWNDPKEFQRIHALMFMKNVAVAGGLIILMVNGAGKYSIKRMIYVLKLPK